MSIFRFIEIIRKKVARKVNFQSKLQKFKILTAVIIKSTVFWDVIPCSLVKIYRSLSGYTILQTEYQILFFSNSSSEKWFGYLKTVHKVKQVLHKCFPEN